VIGRAGAVPAQHPLRAIASTERGDWVEIADLLRVAERRLAVRSGLRDDDHVELLERASEGT